MIFYLANNQLAGTQAEAKALDKNFEQVDVPTDKPGLMAYINELMGREHPQQVEEFVPSPPPAPVIPKSIQFEDQWDDFPLALKLHYAASAMEDARDTLK